MSRRHVLGPGNLPRGLCREKASEYVGVSPTLFDEMVKDGRMPAPKAINSRRVWDLRALDLAFDGLPDIDNNVATSNPWHNT